jgi:hypothetical protein
MPHVRLVPIIVCKTRKSNNLEISRKLIFGLLCGCVAFQRLQGGPWSILDETMWSPHVAGR